MKKTNPSDTPVYRRALKSLNSAIAELVSTRHGRRGRPSRQYVTLMDAVAANAVTMKSGVYAAFLDAAAKRGMTRQLRRAIARA